MVFTIRKNVNPKELKPMEVTSISHKGEDYIVTREADGKLKFFRKVKRNTQFKTSKKSIKEKIASLETKKAEIIKEIWRLKDNCKENGHSLVKTDWDGARCEICGESFGWWCPKSPDHTCHYSKSLDSCDYCGQPEERK